MKHFILGLIKPYIHSFEHFCIHAGRRAELDELEKNLQLLDWPVEPSRMSLYRFGNTSSTSLWYELAYTESKARVRRGRKSPWMDEIEDFPVLVPKFSAI